MKVPFGDLTRDEQEILVDGVNLKSRIREKIGLVLDKKNFILGAEVAQFEEDFAGYCGVKYCIGVANGLSALELSLIGLGISTGDEVITVANTFNATVGAIVKTGAKPILVDASNLDFNIDTEKIAQSITPRTKAIIPVHLYGQTANMYSIMTLANSRNIPVIEDACQSHGAFYNDQRAGSFGIAGCFSFYPGKNLGAYGDGGAIVTHNNKLAEFLMKTRNYGQTIKYHHDVRPDNSRLDTIQAVVVKEKLKVLDKLNAMRMCNAQFYRTCLQEVKDITLPSERQSREHVYHLFVIKAEKRDELEKHLESQGIQTGKHYPIPIHLQQCFSSLGYKRGDFPVSEKLAGEILSLPMFPTLKSEEIRYTCDAIKQFYGNNSV